MQTLRLRRIHCADTDAAAQLAALRTQLSSQGEVVSPRGRQLTEAVFGEALPPARVVERICADVRQRGLPAVLRKSDAWRARHPREWRRRRFPGVTIPGGPGPYSGGHGDGH